MDGLADAEAPPPVPPPSLNFSFNGASPSIDSNAWARCKRWAEGRSGAVGLGGGKSRRLKTRGRRVDDPCAATDHALKRFYSISNRQNPH